MAVASPITTPAPTRSQGQDHLSGCGSVFKADPTRRPAAQPVVPGFSGPNISALASQSPNWLMQPSIGIFDAVSPAELRQKVQTQQLESGVEYSWLPSSPKRIRVKKPASMTIS
ncbi:MAG: hypothetical protein CM15mP74_05760 [Halieaceae bacterium]|nr:MAG: hypothetical protein CM15mP74_05760 [Halieaceae bacterium]